MQCAHVLSVLEVLVVLRFPMRQATGGGGGVPAESGVSETHTKLEITYFRVRAYIFCRSFA